MSHFKAKMHQILFPVSIRLFLTRSTSRSDVDTAWRRRSWWTSLVHWGRASLHPSVCSFVHVKLHLRDGRTVHPSVSSMEFDTKQAVHTHLSLTPSSIIWISEAKTETVELASHWPSVIDIVVNTTIGAKGLRQGDEHLRLWSYGL